MSKTPKKVAIRLPSANYGGVSQSANFTSGMRRTIDDSDSKKFSKSPTQNPNDYETIFNELEYTRGQLDLAVEETEIIKKEIFRFFMTLRGKIFSQHIPRGENIDRFLNIKEDELELFIRDRPNQFLGLFEAILSLHLDKVYDYRGPKYVSNNFMGNIGT